MRAAIVFVYPICIVEGGPIRINVFFVSTFSAKKNLINIASLKTDCTVGLCVFLKA